MMPGDKVFYLWGAVSDFASNPSWRWRAYERYLMRRVWAPTSLFNEQVLAGYLEQLNHFQPRVIYAYPTPLALFCEFLRDAGKPFHRPATAICTAEPLLAEQRDLIESTLQCRVFELYGSREFGMIAGDCEHGKLHLNPFAAYVEFIPMEGATDGLCELVVTDLLNYGMPLIRYRINDCAVPITEKCPCGRGYAVLGAVSGRTADNFKLPSGNVVPGVSLTNRVIKTCPGLKKIQIVQDSLSEFRVRYVPSSSFSAADLRSLHLNSILCLPCRQRTSVGSFR
jgi:phenylacetate-CoA ligase